MRLMRVIFLFAALFLATLGFASQQTPPKTIAYIVSDINIPFWKIMSKGIANVAHEKGYALQIYTAQNSSKKELEQTMQAIRDKVSGIIVSPTNSSACVTILKLAKTANIPVVISDIGTDSGEYVSYISSNNFQGAYDIGQMLADVMHKKEWDKGSVGIIAIPQKRLNGQARTAGFMKALNEATIKGADIKQFKSWDDKETYNYIMQMIQSHTNLRAIWLQTSNMYQGAIDAIRDAKKEKELLLVAFDAEPEFLELIPKGVIIGSGMQQPFLMGEKAALALTQHLNSQKVDKAIQIPILNVSTQNINEKLPIIKRNVLGELPE